MSDLPVDSQPATPPAPSAGTRAPPSAPGGLELRGTPVAPGLVLARVHRKDYDLSRARPERVPLDAVEGELNRLRRALEDSRLQLLDLQTRLEGRVPLDDARILDTHLAYLKDSVFIADVENLIVKEQLGLEAAIGKVIADFDRIFRLVQNETLRQSAVDLRDVGIRVLRNLETPPEQDASEAEPQPYILVARELSIVDMFDLSNRHVQGIATEAGGLTSHAAIFARSMRIPTVTGVEGLLERVQEGDFVILDASEGILRVNPEERVRAQYERSNTPSELPAAGAVIPAWARRATRTQDGVELFVSAACGNLPEVEQCAALGVREVGLYRTELLYLLDKEAPSRDALVRHYQAVTEQARGQGVCFRLLNLDSGVELPWLHAEREHNPAMGRAGVRLLLAREALLRRQLQAILLAAPGARLRIALPFISDCGELRRIKEILFEERLELKKSGLQFQDKFEVGCVIETPASVLGMRDLARESDFLTVNFDSLVQYLMAADRDNPELAEWITPVHPFVLRALRKLASVCEEQDKPLSIFGLSASEPSQLSALVGIGLRRFAVTPASLRAFLVALRGLDSRLATRNALISARGSSSAESQSQAGGYRHGYARP